jgi:predicted nicotinamide N-methyase
VLDFAAGCGLAAIACAMAGAASVTAAEIDALAVDAIALNAAENHVSVIGLAADLAGEPPDPSPWDLILCGDVCYEAPMTRHILPWLQNMASQVEVWIADPGRAYLPTQGMNKLAGYRVATSLELETRTESDVTLFRLAAS